MANATRFLAKSLSLIIIFALCGFLTLAFLLYQGEDGEIKDVVIPRHSSLKQVVEILSDDEIVNHPFLFKCLLRVTGGSHKVRAGEFHFKHDMKAYEAIYALYYSEPVTHQVTIPEGWTGRQIASVLAAQGLIDPQKFLALVYSQSGPKKYGVNLPNYEGLLFPDTYLFSKVDGEEHILERMVSHFFQKVNKPIADEAKARGMTIEQALTLASIIEKETGVPTERALVSSVFHNRMMKHMRLQSDPTTIYGIPNFNGHLSRADLERYTPYNTYVIPGLPPGPICNPGLDAVLAAIRPASTSYYYFVSNNNGSHIFSETYAQHARKVFTYHPPVSRRLGRVGN